eukprot:gene10753-7481_t
MILLGGKDYFQPESEQFLFLLLLLFNYSFSIYFDLASFLRFIFRICVVFVSSFGKKYFRNQSSSSTIKQNKPLRFGDLCHGKKTLLLPNLCSWPRQWPAGAPKASLSPIPTPRPPRPIRQLKNDTGRPYQPYEIATEYINFMSSKRITQNILGGRQ